MIALTSVVGLTLVLSSALPQRGAHARPGLGQGPTPVEVGIYVNDILKADGAEQLLTIDFFLVQRWTDESLAGGVARSLSPAELWTPNVVVVNEGRLFPKMPERVAVDPQGNLRITQRFVGTLSISLELTDFPFDDHLFRAQVAVGTTQEQVHLVNATDLSGQRPEMTLTDWELGTGRVVSMPYYFAPSGEDFAGLAYEIPAKRRLAFYVWKGIVPLSLVVVMAFTVFWIDPEQLGSRISVSVTSMLTLIAYRFLLGAMLPRLAYLTRLDWFTLGCTALVFLTLTSVVTIAYLKRTDRQAASVSIDRLARWVFPLGFAANFAISFLA